MTFKEDNFVFALLWKTKKRTKSDIAFKTLENGAKMKLNAYLAKSTFIGALGGLLFGFDTAVISVTHFVSEYKKEMQKDCLI